MSKSKGNTVEPQTVTKENGAEILRLWVAMVDYSEDQRIGKTILQTTIDAYRKLRNTLRYLLGALAGFDRRPSGWPTTPTCRRWSATSCTGCGSWTPRCSAAYAAYRFNERDRGRSLDFCHGRPVGPLLRHPQGQPLLRRARRRCAAAPARTVMDLCFERLTVWLSPLARFTMEEAWTTRFPDGRLQRPADDPGDARPPGATTPRPRAGPRSQQPVTCGGHRRAGGRAAREADRLGAGGRPEGARSPTPDLLAAFEGVDAAEVFRTSQATLIAGRGRPRAFTPGRGHRRRGASPSRRGRSAPARWRILPEVGTDPRLSGLDLRDADGRSGMASTPG